MMHEKIARKAVLEAIKFARCIERKSLIKIEDDSSYNTIRLMQPIHSESDIEKYAVDIAKEYHFSKSPVTRYGLISKLVGIEGELTLLISKLNALKHSAPDTFDDIASEMYCPYLRTGELEKGIEYRYKDPQWELGHLLSAIELVRVKKEHKSKSGKKRGNYWSRIAVIWKQITAKIPMSSQNSDFINFAEKIFNAWNEAEDTYESAEALSKDYKRYLESVRT